MRNLFDLFDERLDKILHIRLSVISDFDLYLTSILLNAKLPLVLHQLCQLLIIKILSNHSDEVIDRILFVPLDLLENIVADFESDCIFLEVNSWQEVLLFSGDI